MQSKEPNTSRFFHPIDPRNPGQPGMPGANPGFSGLAHYEVPLPSSSGLAEAEGIADELTLDNSGSEGSNGDQPVWPPKRD